MLLTGITTGITGTLQCWGTYCSARATWLLGGSQVGGILYVMYGGNNETLAGCANCSQHGLSLSCIVGVGGQGEAGE